MKKAERKNAEKLLRELSPYYNRNADKVSKMSDRELEITYGKELMGAKMAAKYVK